MDIREKLVELIAQKVCGTWSESCDEWLPHDCGKCYANDCRISEIADHLIINGVTVQEWIPVDDKLPPYNRDVLVYRPNMAMKILVDSYDGYYGEDDDEWHEGWARYGNDIHGKPIITHWAYLPQPPKGE